MGSEYLNKILTGEDFSYENLADREYYRCTFSGCKFVDTIMDHTEFDDCSFIDCNITNPQINQAVFNGINFTDSKVMGLSLYNCKQMTFDLNFKNCWIDNCNFSDLVLKKSEFINCEINECFFQQTNLEGVLFDDSTFKNTLFHKARLKSASFRNAKGYSIDPLTNDISRAAFSVPDVMNLLAGFGIKILD